MPADTPALHPWEPGLPLVAHSSLPAFGRLREEGMDVGEAHPDLDDLHIGLLDLMPDAALAATDRQFLRLVSGYTDRANLYVFPFTLAAGHRSQTAQAYVFDHYAEFDDLRETGLDALIVTGANPAHFELRDEPFWDGLGAVFDWADSSVHSTLCSCLATHALLEHRALLKRARLPEKRWGVYQHAIVTEGHPLLQGLQAPIEAPHSHWFDMTREEMEAIGLTVLVLGDEAGVHMASSSDGFRYVFFQGHPEYDDISLLKEYEREISRFLDGEREYPPFPDNYFDEATRAVLDEYRKAVESGGGRPEFPEEAVVRHWRPTWFAQGQTIYANWLAEVHRRVRS